MRIVDLFRDGAPASVRDAVEAMEIVLSTAREMWVAATSALLYNETLSIDLEKTDRIIDDQERAIRRLVHEHVEAHPRQDLDLSLMIVSVVQDGERIGDLAKSIGGLPELASKPLMGPQTYALRAIRDRITKMFDQTRRGFIDGDTPAARAVMTENEEIKRSLRGFVKDLAHSQDTTVNEGVILANGSLMMGRVSSHLSNIASTVVLPFEYIRGPSRPPGQG